MTAAVPEQGAGRLRDEFSRHIPSGVQECLVSLADMNLVPEQGHDHSSGTAMAVTAVIGFAGHYQGLLSLHCPKALAWRITEAMLGIPPEIDDVNDAIGEVVNIIGGKVKEVLAPGGLDVSLSIPAVFHGEGLFSAGSDKDVENVCYAFSHENDRLLVAIKVKKAECS